MPIDDELRAAGLTVEEWAGWASSGRAWAQGRPAGLMIHHTAAPVPFPIGKLAGQDQGRIKCNINVKPDGTIWLVAAGACNYSSGGGMQQVLDEVRAGTPPSANARDRGWNPDGSDDDADGNPYFWNFEVDHLGDGSDLPSAAEDALLVAAAIVARHYGLGPENTISHAEWTARKGDPYWNGSRRAIEEVRAGMSAYELESEDDMALTEAEIEAIAQRAAALVWAKTFSTDSGPKAAGWILGQSYALDQRAVRGIDELAADDDPIEP